MWTWNTFVEPAQTKYCHDSTHQKLDSKNRQTHKHYQSKSYYNLTKSYLYKRENGKTWDFIVQYFHKLLPIPQPQCFTLCNCVTPCCLPAGPLLKLVSEVAEPFCLQPPAVTAATVCNIVQSSATVLYTHPWTKQTSLLKSGTGNNNKPPSCRM